MREVTKSQFRELLARHGGGGASGPPTNPHLAALRDVPGLGDVEALMSAAHAAPERDVYGIPGMRFLVEDAASSRHTVVRVEADLEKKECRLTFRTPGEFKQGSVEREQEETANDEEWRRAEKAWHRDFRKTARGRRKRMIGIIAPVAFVALVLGLGIVAVKLSNRRASVTIVSIESKGTRITAQDKTLNPAWEFDFGAPIRHVGFDAPYGPATQTTHYHNMRAPGEGLWHRLLHGPGSWKYVVVAATFENASAGGRAVGLNPDGGAPAWQMDYRELFGPIGTHFGLDWTMKDAMRYSVGTELMRALLFQHSSTWLWAVVVLDETDSVARVLGRFVNAGDIAEMSIYATKANVLLTLRGISELRDAGMVAMLDATQPTGASPEDDGSKYACAECAHAAGGTSGLLKYFVFPRSEVNVASRANINWVTAANQPKYRNSSDGFNYVVYTEELNSPRNGKGIDSSTLEQGAFAKYRFSLDLEQLESTSFDSNYVIARQALESHGVMRRSRNSSQQTGPPLVRAWEPKRGWYDLKVAVR